MRKTVIPEGYRSLLSLNETQKAISLLKRLFEDRLAGALRLHRVSAPLFVSASSGLNDDLNGVERPVSFEIIRVVVTAQVVIMKADVDGNNTSTDSLKDLTFAVESGSAGEDAVKDLGITDYVAVQDQTKAVMEVSAGTADACVVDITLANAMTGEGTNYDDLASGISLSSEEYGVGFRKESDLPDAFNKFMEKCLADGSLQALADKYSLTLVG